MTTTKGKEKTVENPVEKTPVEKANEVPGVSCTNYPSIEPKKRVFWTTAGSDMVVDFGPYVMRFDILVLFPNFLDLGKTEQAIISYGIKSKCAGAINQGDSGKLPVDEKVIVLAEEYDRIFNKREWNKFKKGIGSISAAVRNALKNARDINDVITMERLTGMQESEAAQFAIEMGFVETPDEYKDAKLDN